MKQFRFKPPKLGDFVLKRMANYEDNISMRGDFNEEFESIAGAKSYFHAWFWYWYHLLKSLPSFIGDSIYWRGLCL